MDTELLTALDDVDNQASDRLIINQAFSPPSLSSSQLKQLELLQHLSLYSDLLMLVCADKGMGKTFIANAVLASREDPDQSLMFEADFSLSYLDILQKLAQFLDLADLANDIKHIEQQVLAQCLKILEEEQGSVLLIVDQADQLSDSILADLNQLVLLAPNALHIMLLAPLAFENKLFTLKEPQAPFHVLEVEPLVDDEAEILLLEQFPEKEWEAEQVDYILQQSMGNPGKILYIAQQLLVGVTPQQKVPATAKFPITHIIALLLVACALVTAYFYQNTSIEHEPEAVVIETKKVVAVSIGQEPLLDMENIIVEPVSFDDSESEVDFNFPQADAPEVTLMPKSVLKKTVLKDKIRLKEAESAYSKDEQLLIAADQGAFVIQIFGSYSSGNAQTFIEENSTSAIQLRRYQTQHQGKPWHVVIAGPFKTKAVAIQNTKRLTGKSRQQKLWVRSVSPIQLDLSIRK